MSKLNKRFWLETDVFFNITGKNNEKISKHILLTGFLYNNSQLGTNTPTLSRLENFPQRILFAKKTQLHKTQYPGLIDTYREEIELNIGCDPTVVDENSSFRQQSKSSPLVFGLCKKEIEFSSTEGSISFGTVFYDAHIYTNIDCSTNHLFTHMTFHELNTLDRIYELERIHLLVFQQCLFKILSLLVTFQQKTIVTFSM